LSSYLSLKNVCRAWVAAIAYVPFILGMREYGVGHFVAGHLRWRILEKMRNIYPRYSSLAAAVVLAFSFVAVRGQGEVAPNVPEKESAKIEAPAAPAAVATTPAKKVVQPALKAIREVELGMSVDDVKHKLGKPDVEDDTGMYFTLNGGDSVQIGLGPDKKVRTVASIYAAGSKNAPSAQEVLGADADSTDGDTYKMIRYPDAGYWVSYSKTNSKDKPVVIVTMRKLS